MVHARPAQTTNPANYPGLPLPIWPMARRLAERQFPSYLKLESEMANTLREFSDELAAQAEVARGFTAEIRPANSSWRSGVLWRADVVVTSEQSLPESDSYEVALGGSAVRATLVGRDPGTNVAVLKLETPVAAALPAPTEPRTGALALAFGADGHGGIAARLGIVSVAGHEWRSRAGGRIARRIELNLSLSHHLDGGPVLDAAGHLIGISTLGHHDTVLVIPPATIERSVGILLAHGHVERGWLGVALHPVAVPENLREPAGQESGLMVMDSNKDGPAAAAGITTGDVLLQIDGERLARMSSLSDRLGPDSVGTQADVKLIRAGSILSVAVKIAARPASSEERSHMAEHWANMAAHWRHHHHHHRGRHGC